NKAGSMRLDAVFGALRSQYDVILVDSPALNTASGIVEFLPFADATLVVVARGRAHSESLCLALEELGAIGANVVGLVVNHSEEVPRPARRHPRATPRRVSALVSAVQPANRPRVDPAHPADPDATWPTKSPRPPSTHSFLHRRRPESSWPGAVEMGPH